MAVALLAQTVEEAWAVIKGLVKECGEGKSDRELEAIGLGTKFKLNSSEVEELFREAREVRKEKVRSGVVEKEPRRLLNETAAQYQARLRKWKEDLAKAKTMIELTVVETAPKIAPEEKPTDGPDDWATATPSLQDWIGQSPGRKIGRALVPTYNRLPAQLRQSITADIELPIASTPLQAVEAMNRKYAHIGSYGGKPQVLSWERWIVKPHLLIPSFQSLEHFKNRYPNRGVEEEYSIGKITGTKMVPVGEWWLRCPGAASYDAVAFEPGGLEVLPGNRLNLWRDWAVKPKPGSWRLLHEHIYRILGDGDPQAGEYIEKWIAWTLQNPDKPCGAILVLQGDEGTGKGTLALALMQIFGIYALPVSDPKHLLGAFSGHLQHCVFLFLDEAFWAGDLSKVEGRLKHLVTEETILIEPKYVTPFLVRNLLHMLMASNNDWVIPAGRTARRYAVFRASKAVMGNKEYFRALRNEILNEDGAAAMLYDLLRMDLGDWSPMEIYQTKALAEQKRQSLRGLDRWLEVLLQSGMLPVPISAKYPNRSRSEDLLRHAQEFNKYVTDPEMTKRLKDVLGCEPKKADEGNKRAWAFPPLPEARQLFERYMHSHWNWDADITEWQYETKGSLLSRPANSV